MLLRLMTDRNSSANGLRVNISLRCKLCDLDTEFH